jgi:predicted acyl esterase
MVPNQKTTIRYTLPDIAHTFKAGHRIKVSVQSSWFPLAEFSPQQYVDLWSCGSKDFISAEIDLYNSSKITFRRAK